MSERSHELDADDDGSVVGAFERCAANADVDSFWSELALEVVRAQDLAGARCLLDVGCGTGRALADLAAPAALVDGGPASRPRLLGVDPAFAAVARARRRLAGVPESAVVQGRVEALPFEAGSVDRLVSLWAFHWTPDPTRAARELARVLAPDGVGELLFTERDCGAELRAATGPVWIRHVGLAAVARSARTRQALDLDTTREHFEAAFRGDRVTVELVDRTFRRTLDSHLAWLRNEGQLASLDANAWDACAGELGTALGALEEDGLVPYRLRALRVRLRGVS